MDNFNDLEIFLTKLPGMASPIAKGHTEDGLWWVKFKFDIRSPFAWQVIQELAYVVNYISPDERLPTVFYPVSPPPYLNGGPDEFLSWVIESKDREFTPTDLCEWLKGRLPDPVDDLNEWEAE